MTRFLHVANGTCTTQVIEAAGLPGAVSIWADLLYEGPVPGGLTDAELVEVRERYHQQTAAITFTARDGGGLDPVNDQRRWRAAIERHDSYDELILWFEHDLFDQLNLIQLLAWIADRLPAATPVGLICVGSFPGRPDFKGLGELTARELASLLDTRQRLDAPHYTLARDAWTAFRDTTPQALDKMRHRDTSALPYLAGALTRFLEEYPSTADGLSRTERRLLALAGDGGVSLNKAFGRMHEGETAYYITDMSLAAMADALSRTSPPLLTLDRGSAGSGRGFDRIVGLTNTGEAVLRHREDRVARCGIDRWLGGVHLQGRGPVWRWDPATERVMNG